MNTKTILLVALLAVLCYTTFARSRPVDTESDKIKFGKIFKGIGKAALKVGKAYANAHGVPLADEEEMSEKKIKFDDIFEWLGKGKQIYDIFKKHKTQPVEPAEEEADKIKIGKALKKIGKGALKVGKAYVGQKYGVQLADEIEELSEKKIKIDDVFNWIGKGKQIYDMFKSDEVQSDAEKKIKFDDIFEWLGKGKAIYDIFKAKKEESESDKIKFGKIFKGIGKAALKVGKAYANAHGVPLSESSNAASTAIAFARSKVGSCYSQASRNGPCYDCSSLIYHAYRSAGKTLPSSSSGYPGNTHQVSDMQPGDILWKSGHVALYIGGGQVIHAENPRTGVRQRDLSYVRSYFGWTRIYRPN